MQTVPSPLTIISPNDIMSLGIDHLDVAEQQNYIRDLAGMIIEAAALRYLHTLAEDDQSVFMSWLQSHYQQPNIIELLTKHYPDFLVIVQAEAKRFLAVNPGTIATTV